MKNAMDKMDYFKELARQNDLLRKQISILIEPFLELKVIERYSLIRELSSEYKKTMLFHLFKVSSSGYYDWIKRCA